MAIYHLAAKIISRNKGRSAIAAAAYRAGEIIACERTGLVFDFRRKKEVAYRQIFAPKNTEGTTNQLGGYTDRSRGRDSYTQTVQNLNAKKPHH